MILILILYLAFKQHHPAIKSGQQDAAEVVEVLLSKLFEGQVSMPVKPFIECCMSFALLM